MRLVFVFIFMIFALVAALPADKNAQSLDLVLDLIETNIEEQINALSDVVPQNREKRGKNRQLHNSTIKFYRASLHLLRLQAR